jgi:TetR/AcrR family transcriptional regulator, transcriptional repressor for nem operon
MEKISTTSDEILALAQKLIVAGGYNGFSYADIAAVVGIRKASIHHHFPSKVDLVRVLVTRYREQAEAGMAALEHDEPNPVELLRAYAGYWVRCVGDSTNPFCVCALLAGELPALPPEVAIEVRAYFRFLSGWLASVLERGTREALITIENTPQVEAEIFMATVHGAMLSARAYDDPKIFRVIIGPALQRLSIGLG